MESPDDKRRCGNRTCGEKEVQVPWVLRVGRRPACSSNRTCGEEEVQAPWVLRVGRRPACRQAVVFLPFQSERL